MKKLFASMAACLFVLAAVAADSTNVPIFQIGLVVDAPANDTERMSVTYPSEYGAVHIETFNVRKIIAFEQTDLKSASVVRNKRYKGVFQVQIALNEEGRKLLADFTRQNVGRRVALIVFGQLDSAPMLKSEIPDGKIWVGVSKSKEKAKGLATRINAAIAKE